MIGRIVFGVFLAGVSACAVGSAVLGTVASHDATTAGGLGAAIDAQKHAVQYLCVSAILISLELLVVVTYLFAPKKDPVDDE